MTYHNSLAIGRSALFASQAALQIAGHNLANAATPGFHRRSIHLLPAGGGMIGHRMFAGNGVQVGRINREIDMALQARWRVSLSREHSLAVDQQFLVALETLQNELGENDLSSALDDFFGAFSTLANEPTDASLASLALQQGEVLAGRLQELMGEYVTLGQQISESVNATVSACNELLDAIAVLNGQIGAAEGNGQEASGLRDQRDLLVDQLSMYIDVESVEQPGGMVDLRVGSIPILLGDRSLGLAVREQLEDGVKHLSLHTAEHGSSLQIEGGSLHGLLRQHAETIQPAIETLQEMAGALIHHVNRLHSQGQGTRGWSSLTGMVSISDPTAVLNSTEAAAIAPIENGAFTIHLRDAETGEVMSSFTINVDGDSMSLQDLASAIGASSGGSVSATIDGDGRLQLSAPEGQELTFSDDTSGALAGLGINTFFTGIDASSIAVNQALLDDPALLAVGDGNLPGSAGTALAIANLGEQELGMLNGHGITSFWRTAVGTLAVRTSANGGVFESASLVRESLGMQLQSVSGVSIDEESINLMAYERQFEAAARYLAVVDETLETLMNLV